MKRINIKKFSQKSRNSAKKAYDLTDAEYDQINAYIRDNNLSPANSILVEETPEGLNISTCDADGTDVLESANPPHSPSGNYLKATFEPGKAPLIQGSSTDPFVSKGFAIITLVASALTVIWYASRFYFDVKDQIAARANGGNAASGNTLSN